MSETKYVELTDALIGCLAADAKVLVLRDKRYPTLSFRYLNNRDFGTWSVLHGGKWAKSADFPATGCKSMFKRVPQAIAGLRSGGSALVPAGDMETVEQLLCWFSAHQQGFKKLSKKRRRSCQSMINSQLTPALSGVLISDLSKPLLYERLIYPAQTTLSVGYVRLLFCVLHSALRCAVSVDRLKVDPIAGLRFCDFGLGKIKPKVARLRPTQLPGLVSMFVARFDDSPRAAMLALMMLMHGTRIGETRQACWRDIRENEGLWIIPADKTKTRVQHEVPLTTEFLGLLDRYRRTFPDGVGVFLFPGVSGRAISETLAALLFAGLSGGEWSSHDLRKLARACWADLDVDSLVCELLLNHALKVLEATYVQLRLDGKKRAALEIWHGRLVEVGLPAGVSTA